MLHPSDRAPGLLLGEGVELPGDADVGGNVVVHAGTAIGSGARLGDGCVIGKPPSLGAHSTSSREEPFQCDAVGESYVKPGVEDVVFALMRFDSGLVAHMHLSWLDPHKERRFTVVGSKRMATFDDMELERKLTVYDKGFDEDYSSYGEYIARSGDAFSPRISNEEPLRIECAHFIECIRDGKEPRSGAESGLRVVRVLEQLQTSLTESTHFAGR